MLDKHFESEQYGKKLDQKNQEISPEDMDKIFERLTSPLSNVDYEKHNQAEIKTDQCEMSFSFSRAVDPSIEGNVLGLLYSHNIHKGDERSKYEKISNIENWKELKTFQFRLEKGELINLFEKLPKNCKIFFYNNETFATGSYYHNHEDKDNKILFIGKLESLISIPILLHEIGHCWDYKKLDELGEGGIGGGLIEGQDDFFLERIRKERYASAFALKILYPLLKADSILKKDIVNLLKCYALAGYCEDAKNSIEQQKIMKQEAMTGHDMSGVVDYSEEEMERDNLFTRFYTWEKTEEYKRWKELEEFKNIEEWEEAGKWKEWIEKQGKSIEDFE